ncbi:hypothetical protein AV903_02195 [Erwinia tracheiphila]|uniref:Uncharacterized protein n=1 Tax=Erwinia tracheiphila TaxID=65700 RepID=A0A345CP20_9GAMM|nr:hypothetical protein AV903_02195 [Erwinia tracheiphila]
MSIEGRSGGLSIEHLAPALPDSSRDATLNKWANELQHLGRMAELTSARECVLSAETLMKLSVLVRSCISDKAGLMMGKTLRVNHD